MKPVLRGVAASVLMLASAGSSCQTPAPPQTAVPSKTAAEISFQFERIGLPVPSFTILLHEDGSGSYKAEQAERPSSGTSLRGEEAKHIDRTMMLRQATATKIFNAARELRFFGIVCTSKLKNIADTGKKTLSYTGADGQGSCVYHFSENKKVDMVADTLIGVAYTMDEGRRLEFLHRYDRLGLDAEMTSLAAEVEAGRALELGTIQPVLAAIADDPAVIQRARLRAAKMLDQSK